MINRKIMTGLKRIHKLQETASQMLLSGILIHNPENIYYLTSVYPHEPSFLVVSPHGEPELVASGSIYAEARKDSLVKVTQGSLDIAETTYQRMLDTGVIKPPPRTMLSSFIRKIAESPLGIEQSYLSVFLLEKFNIRNYTDITPTIMDLRSRKDSFEIDFISKACHIADQSMKEVKNYIQPGITEKELSGLFDAKAKSLGADETKCRVRSGKNSALAFSRWMDEKLDKGPVLIDYGARIRGYWSDITRMFYLGPEPSSLFLEIYDLVCRASDSALKLMKPGQDIHGPEISIREIFREKGYEKFMIYTAGHGIGLEVHEPPLLSLPGPEHFAPGTHEPSQARESLSTAFISDEENKAVFHRNQVFALEPGIYLDQIGVRVEDMVCISDEPVLLSTFPKDLEQVIISC
ncbi:M24 family metallopeptidase [Desulfonatronovibrio hydrogenovorans]|uniref:M24 family metallopeptidase n=1 Tax=Desulfonatronovibrio hydrogenovorans TaxID=53245 RepID=UPI00048DA0FB|nr:Xaa-Pro peptidase family protein [Desulfonatronovibrio hydrogenovorans]